MNYLLIIQARMSSKRLPGKIMLKLGNLSVIEFIYSRLKKSKKIDAILVATTKNKSDDILCNLLSKKNINFFRGSENDVLKRFYDASTLYKAKNIIRITADCPLVDHRMLNDMIDVYEKKGQIDYLSNSNPPTFPDGLDIEIFNKKSLDKIYKSRKNKYDKEHVTPLFKKLKIFKIFNYANKIDYSNERWTLDEQDDYLLIKKILKKMNHSVNFKWSDIINLKKKYPNIFNTNKHIKRNEGANMTGGQKLWRRAVKVIPSGNMFLSKHPKQFLPNLWPSYFSKSKGCEVWDIDNKKYLDFCLMGVGTNILGYSNNVIDSKVKNIISKGTMSSLNCPEEVFLSEKLLKIHKSFDQVKLARTGGEANAIAIRIARTSTKKQKVLVCGYHGWHDWYLSANLQNSKNLDDHLLPGLSPIGVNKKLKNTIKTFEFNNFIDFKNKIDSDKEIGIVKMEVARTYEPSNNFLKKIRNYTSKKNIILIFDECTTGFREHYGGLYKKYKVIPDMVVFGKAIGNGYPITAVIGKKEIMENASQTFMSSTFWSERIGPTAAIATLDEMKRIKSWDIVTKKGKEIKERWKKLFKKYEIDANVWGLNAIIGFNFNSDNNLKYKSLITYELLKKKILATNALYVSVAHSQQLIDKYFYEFEKTIKLIHEFENGRNIDHYLKIDIASTTFKRLN